MPPKSFAETPRKASRRELCLAAFVVIDAARNACRVTGILLAALLLAGCVAGATPRNPPPSLEPSTSPVPSATTVPATASPTDSPTPTATPTPQCQNPQGSVVNTSYVGAVIREPLKVRLYLPPCYADTQLNYPALYLLHGWPYNESHWDDLGAVEVASSAIAEGTWPPFILVMPYAPTILFTGTDGGSWSYEGEFVQGLVPWVDATYRTIDSPYWRGFAGISRGGIWSLEVALLHPDLIDNVAALSPAFALNLGRPMYDPFRLIYRGEPRPHRFMLMAGETDWARLDTLRFSQELDRLRIAHDLLVVPGGHLDDTWSQAMPEVLAFFASAWREDTRISAGAHVPNPPEN